MGWPENQWRCDDCGGVQTGDIPFDGRCNECRIKHTENYKRQVEMMESPIFEKLLKEGNSLTLGIHDELIRIKDES